ncbi:MAG: urea transporter [Pseudomonadota bacterium]|nr:urea transporter [Pseudomonadota bacterium]
MIFGKGNWQDAETGAGALAATPWRGLVGLLRAYSSILFVDNPLVGLLFFAATFFYPNVGLAGLLGALVGIGTARLFNFPHLSSGLYVYNSMLVGLSLGAFYQLDIFLVLLIILSAALTVFLVAALLDVLWRLGHLPILSLPFVLMALTAALAAKSYGTLTPYLTISTLRADWLGEWLDAFFSALGAIFFSPHPLVGLLLFLGILVRSRYLAALCVAGFAVGYAVFQVLTANPEVHPLSWTGFNFVLTAMALGGVFMVPGRASFVLALVASALAALLTAAFSNLFLVYNLPVMALPFLLATLTVLAALRMRIGSATPILMLDHPALPEVNFERARIARARIGDFNSVPLLAPFFGEWGIYQGFAGRHTHQGAWQHALDFHRTENGRSYQGEGTRLTDFYCFNLPILSPVHGAVVRTEQDNPDNRPGEVDTQHNWGNFVLIQLDSGLHVLLAHLAQHSLKVKEGERVTPGSVIGRCGNSGRSPQPHLHLQVQRDARLGSGTVPFHLSNVVIATEETSAEFRLVAHPEEGVRVKRAEEDNGLAAQLHLPVGRCLRYRLRCAEQDEPVERELHVELTLLGQFRLVTDRGASVAFEEEHGVLAFFDRQGPRDPFLDLWLLAMSLTPLTGLAEQWGDAPAAGWLPLGRLQRLWLALLHPLGGGLESHFRREWDESAQVWCQRAEHTLRLTGVKWLASTKAVLSPLYGCVEFTLQFGNRDWSARLIETGQIADRGVPAWGVTVPPTEDPIT